jgi:hypothetical protein
MYFRQRLDLNLSVFVFEQILFLSFCSDVFKLETCTQQQKQKKTISHLIVKNV